MNTVPPHFESQAPLALQRHPIFYVGMIGLVMTLFLNVLNFLLLHHDSMSWWSIWFPLHAVWLNLLIVGWVLSRRDEHRNKSRF